MSHFTVLVIGENPESQLAPFHEYECTGIKDEHVIFIDDEEYDVDEETGRKGHWTNPNRKWDWYSLGGRWAGFFTLKADKTGKQGHHRAKDFAKIDGATVEDLPEIKVDQCLKGDIDFDRMRLEEQADALKDYTEFILALNGEPFPPDWNEFRERHENIDMARSSYAEIQSVKNLRQSRIYDFDHFLKTEDQYVNERVNKCFTTFAIIKDGKWFERGEMGWWGIVLNEKDSWDIEFKKLFDSLSDDTLLSVYDCHI